MECWIQNSLKFDIQFWQAVRSNSVARFHEQGMAFSDDYGLPANQTCKERCLLSDLLPR